MVTKNNSVGVWIGGAAGEGIASAGDVLARAAARAGLGFFAHNSYQSVIRGGLVLLQSRLGAFPVRSHSENWDYLVALSPETLALHAKSARPGGRALFNSDKVKPASLPPAVRPCGVPVGELTKDISTQPIIQNIVLLGALGALLKLPWDIFESSVRAQFGKKKTELAELNIKAARRGWEHAEKNFTPQEDLALAFDGKKRMLLTGNQAIALGALAGGCKFYSAYPMTPASTIMHYLAPRASRYGLLMKQTEDEIAAINMAIGAGYAGARAMTGTSGGGFALMTEALGLAGMLEAPVVAVLVQRGGPSTGLPTKTEQADLFQALGASQGEYPKAVLAPLDVADAYDCTVQALNLADKYQMPITIVTDLLLSEHMETVAPESFTHNVPIERGEIVAGPAPAGYMRYADTPSGVSPRTLPGTAGGMHAAASDEHDVDGHLISDVFTNPSTRAKMVEKRMRKMDGVKKEVKGLVVEGPPAAELTLVGWGSTYPILKEARLALEAEGRSVNHIQFRSLYPFPAEAAQRLLNFSKKTVCVENNFGGLFARLLRQETGVAVHHRVRKFDGEPFALGPLLPALRGCLNPGAPDVQTLVSAELDIPRGAK